MLHILCFTVTWIAILGFLWSSFVSFKKGVTHVKTLHQIPCARCQFFTGSYYLKCTIHPQTALTEEALSCTDYCERCDRNSYSKML
ncbi:MAG: hypothetical protein LRZ84_22525 [Desertifilum sp.]|nr:hypothetical protein [Desertifilum sp.]